jgi:alpha-galactosidase
MTFTDMTQFFCQVQSAVRCLFVSVLGNNFRAAPHPVPLPIGWGEGGRRSGEGCTAFLSEIIYAKHSRSSRLRGGLSFVWLALLLGLVVQSSAAVERSMLFLIGDSTVRNGSGKGADSMWGWGSLLGAHFDPAKIQVENRAIGGRSSRTFLTEGRWENVLKEMKPGDFVMMQFGHNDGGGLTGNRGRGSLKGNGDETQSITNNAGQVETVHTYGWYLRQYIAGAKAKGVTPIVLSQIPRNIWKDGKVGRESNGYGKFAREAAAQGGAAFLDLNEIVANRYEKIGAETVGAMFFRPGDHTHTTLAGAKLNAAAVVQGVRGLPDAALAEKLLPPESAPPKVDFLLWAPTPPMGWNSWDCFATTVTEVQTKAQADVMAEKLKTHGWQYVVVDIQWYEPDAKSFDYRKDAALIMDEFGHLFPATNRFPSAAQGVGFKALADYVHGKGLKFGIHLMRGIPRQAVRENTPVKGTSFRARDIANTNSICPWNPDMYGVDMSKPGAQEYYDSVFQLIASWGVDYVKVDDLSRPYDLNRPEIEAIRKAIDRTGRPMLLSTSPGETPVAEGAHVAQHANLWRISDDFWDEWRLLRDQFERLRKWAPFIGPGHWPDADMLPLGKVRFGKPAKFTRDEQFTLMTLWSIARSPLMMGGDLTQLDDFTLSLLTNDEVLAVNQSSSGNKQLFNRDGLIAWVADAPGLKDKYLAVFNTRDASSKRSPERVVVTLSELGFSGAAAVRDLWAKQDLAQVSAEIAFELPAHGAMFYRLVGERMRAPALRAAAPPGLDQAYLFTYFIGNGEDGLHLAWSRDGYKWEALKDGKSFLTPVVGEKKLMRDPCVVRGPDGIFHMVWTTAWEGKTIGHASSKDLINWSPQQAVPVMAQEPAAINCWAPEIVWDAKRSEYLIFWATTITNQFLETAGGGDAKYNHRMYATTTKDFKSFTPTKLFYDPGFNVIDATILPAFGRYYLIIKDETRNPVKKHLRVASSEDIAGPYSDLQPPFTRDWVEGPSALQVGEEFLVYFDAYRDRRYEAMVSPDLKKWEDVTSKISFPKGTKHGTAIAVEKGFVDELISKTTPPARK